MHIRPVSVGVGLLLSLVLSVTPLLAQGALSEVNGTTVDQSGAVLPGVAVTLTEETTGLVRTVTTNEAGRGVLPALQPGRYTIKAELAGFQTQNRAGLIGNVGQALTINLTLPVGGLADQVTVTGEAPLVEVTKSEVGTNITAQNIDALPTAGRQQYALLALVPGMTPTLAAGSFEGAQYSAGGQSTSNNVFMVDGAYNNDDRTQSGPGIQTRMTIDSTAEYQVLVHDFGAEYGGAAGAVINAVTKGGSNQYHGRGAYSQEQGVLLLQLRTPAHPPGGRSPVSPRRRAARRLLLDVPAGQLRELLRARGLSDQPIEQREHPRRVRSQPRQRAGPRRPVADDPGDAHRACAEARRDVHQRPVAARDGQPDGQRGPDAPRQREPAGRRSADVRKRRLEHDLQGQRISGTEGRPVLFRLRPGASRLRDRAVRQPRRSQRHDDALCRAADVYADEAHPEVRRGRQPQRRYQCRRHQLHRALHVPDQRGVRRRQSVHLSQSIRDSARRAVPADEGLADRRLRVRQMAGDADADAHARCPLRLPARSAADEGCVRAAAGDGAGAHRQAADSRRRREVLSVPVDGDSGEPVRGRGERAGLRLRYGAGHKSGGRAPADARHLPPAGQQRWPGGNQPGVPRAACRAAHVRGRGRLRQHRTGARWPPQARVSVVLRRGRAEATHAADGGDGRLRRHARLRPDPARRHQRAAVARQRHHRAAGTVR